MEIKETMEVLEGLKEIGVLGASVFADGKINLKDLSSLVKFLGEVGDIIKAVEGIDLVDDEIKDIDEAELAQIGTKTFEIIQAIKKAYEENKE